MVLTTLTAGSIVAIAQLVDRGGYDALDVGKGDKECGSLTSWCQGWSFSITPRGIDVKELFFTIVQSAKAILP